MKRLLCITVAGLLSVGATAAELYGSASYGALETELGNTDFDTPTLNLGFGGILNRNFAIEGRIGLGIDEDNVGPVELEIEDYFAIYAKPMLPLSDTVSLYGLLGLAETTLDSNVGDEDDDDISYGLGISARVGQGLDLFGEYISLYDDDNVEINGFNLGANLRF